VTPRRQQVTGVHLGVHIAGYSEAFLDLLRGFEEMSFFSSALIAFLR
jgi:hypothetical protein